MEWLSYPQHQGIAIAVAMAQMIFAMVYYAGPDPSQPSGIWVRTVRGVLLPATGWLIYSIPWALLALAMGFPPSIVLGPVHFTLGAFAVIGAMSTKNPSIGGLIGGGVPLATLSLFYLSSNPQMQATASPLAWFGMFMLFGGLLGALTGPAALGVLQAAERTLRAWSRHGGGRRRVREDPSRFSFDAFISHNSRDKPAVRALTRALASRGLRVWLDEEQLVPGRPWQEEVERIIQTSRTAVVLIGKDGLGPWEIPEMRACLSQFVNRHMPVIPVLLPDASALPELPLFLREVTWVDLRSGLTEENLDRLEWGITGVKPERPRS